MVFILNLHERIFKYNFLQRQPFQGKNRPEKNHWFSRDLDAMAEVTGCLPILVDADAGKSQLLINLIHAFSVISTQ